MTAPAAYRPGTLSTPPTPYDGVDLKDAVLGNLGMWLALGLSLLVLGFAAGVALDPVDPGDPPHTALYGVPALLVALLPFLASPVLALGTGAWSGHATRSGRLGAIAGATGGLIGPIILVLFAAIGLSLGAGAADVNLDAAQMPYGLGAVGDWNDALAYLLTGAGLLVLLASAVSGATAGGIVGSLLDGRFRSWFGPRVDRPDTRPPLKI